MGLKKPPCVLWREQKASVLGDGFEPGGPMAQGSVGAQ